VSDEAYEVRVMPPARRAIAHRLPEPVAAAVIEFCASDLATDPYRVGKPLFGPLAGCHAARRGSYRVVYRIDDEARRVQVLEVAHRADVYRQR
jgi:mRNA interferase RelE/StbE